MANSQNATPEIRAMWDEAKSILNARCGEGAVTDAEITTEAHETWASSLEDYFMKGKAPSLELQSVFAKFAAWLKRIYMSFRQLGKTPAPELDHLFQRMFATDEQIAEVEQPSTFNRYFKQLTGLSLLQFQKKLRLYEAERLMLLEGKNAGTAALMVGYESNSQFNREYKRQFGESPCRDVIKQRS